MAKPSVYIDESYVKNDDTCRLYIRLYIGKSYVHVPIGVSANVKLFNKKTFQVRGEKSKDKSFCVFISNLYISLIIFSFNLTTSKAL